MIARHIAVLIAVLFWLGPVSAKTDANIINATIDLSPNFGKDLKLEREDKPFKLTDKTVHLAFEDPRKKGEIKKIIFNPAFLPAKDGNSDFWLTATIKGRGGKTIHESADCDWEKGKKGKKGKTKATCSIEDDGGHFDIRVDQGTGSDSGKTMVKLSLEPGGQFRIAAEPETSEGVGAAYELKAVGANAVSLPVNVTP